MKQAPIGIPNLRDIRQGGSGSIDESHLAALRLNTPSPAPRPAMPTLPDTTRPRDPPDPSGIP